MLMGEFKQEILRINNKVNMEIFKQGLLTQRVDVMHNRAVIIAKNRRVAVLDLPYVIDKASTEIMDRTLINIFKQRFIQLMKEELGVTVVAHLKDYDPEHEIAASVTFFEDTVEQLLPKLPSPPRQTNKSNRAGQAQSSQPDGEG